MPTWIMIMMTTNMMKLGSRGVFETTEGGVSLVGTEEICLLISSAIAEEITRYLEVCAMSGQFGSTVHIRDGRFESLLLVCVSSVQSVADSQSFREDSAMQQ